MDATDRAPGYEPSPAGRPDPQVLKGIPATLLNAYPSQVSKRSRIKNARQFLESGWRAVSVSSFIVGLRYHARSRRLYLDFKNGGLGYYHPVDPDLAAEFFVADSHGDFLHSRLKTRCSWVSIRDGGKKGRWAGSAYSSLPPGGR